MPAKRNSLVSCILIFCSGVVLVAYYSIYRNWTENLNRTINSIPDSYRHQQWVEKIGYKTPIIYYLLENFSKHETWSLSKFFKMFGTDKNENYSSQNIPKRKICILNVDTRPVERFSEIKDFEKMNYHSLVVYNNLFYAIQHGYDYLRVIAPPSPEYSHPWLKVAHLYDTIFKYDIVVFFDSDVYVRYPNTSMEFLMARYNFTVNSSLLMAVDPNAKLNQDSKGRIVLNTGFIIAQSNSLTKQILKKWALCIETIPNCSEWRDRWSREQRSFSEYFREQMKLGTEIIAASCDELNGYDTSGSGCSGTIVTHVWTAKHTLMERLKKLMLGNLMTLLEQSLWKDKHIYTASTSDIKTLVAE